MKYYRLALSIFCSALTLSLAACSSETGDRDQASAANLEQNDGWVLTTGINKFSDQQTAIAQRSFDVDGVRIDLAIKCVADRIDYTFTAFDSSNEGVAFRTKTEGSRYSLQGNTYSVLTIRPDEDPAMTIRAYIENYNNQVTINDYGGRGSITDARRLLIRLRLLDRDVDLEIDQTTPNILAVLEPCIESQQKLAAKYQREGEDHRAEIEADIDAMYSDDSVISGDLRRRAEYQKVELDEDRFAAKVQREEARKNQEIASEARSQEIEKYRNDLEKQAFEAERLQKLAKYNAELEAEKKRISDSKRVRDAQRQAQLDQIARNNDQSKTDANRVQDDAEAYMRELERISAEQRKRR